MDSVLIAIGIGAFILFLLSDAYDRYLEHKETMARIKCGKPEPVDDDADPDNE